MKVLQLLKHIADCFTTLQHCLKADNLDLTPSDSVFTFYSLASDPTQVKLYFPIFDFFPQICVGMALGTHPEPPFSAFG